MNARKWWLASIAAACCSVVAAAQDDGSPSGGDAIDMSDGLSEEEALTLAEIISDLADEMPDEEGGEEEEGGDDGKPSPIDVARAALDLGRNAAALDSEEAACGTAYTEAAGPTVPSSCAEDEACRDCYEEAVRRVDFNRYYIERARCITAANVKMANSAIAFGDTTSGIHAVAGLSWQLQGKPQIVQAVNKLKTTYTNKAGQYLSGLEGALKELGRCEAEHYGERDWYQRYGWLYHNFMKAKYASAPE